MTQNQTESAPPTAGSTPPPALPRPALRRTTGEANVIGGVAAGIARSLGIDPILVRVTFVVLAIFGGSGLLLYIAGWLFIPEDGRADSIGERFLRNNSALAIAAAAIVGVVVVGPLLVWGFWSGGPGFGGVVLLFLVIAAVVALTRRGDDAAVPSAAAPATVPPDGPTSPTLALPSVAPPPTTPAPKPPREKSVLGRLTVGITLSVAGTLIALDVADVIEVDAVTVIASALGVVALGLLVGTVVGRSRGLIALGVILVLVLVPLGAIPDDIRWNAGAGMGDPVYRITSQDDLQPVYKLGIGELTLDLRRLDVTEPVEIDASLGAGELRVLLPADVAVTMTADVAVGTIDLPGERSTDGSDLSSTWERPASDPSTIGSLDLTLSTGLGQVTLIDDTLEVVR